MVDEIREQLRGTCKDLQHNMVLEYMGCKSKLDGVVQDKNLDDVGQKTMAYLIQWSVQPV